MPEWLEAIRTEVPDNQLKEFREVLRWVSSSVKSLLSRCLTAKEHAQCGGQSADHIRWSVQLTNHPVE